MRTVNIHAAKTQLSRLVDAAAAGEEIIIAKSGKPLARLGPLVDLRRRRRLGALAGQLRVTERPEPRSKAVTSRCCLAPPAFGRSPSRPVSAAPILRSIRPRLPDRRSTPGLPNCRSAQKRLPLSHSCLCSTAIRSTAFFSRRRSSSPQPSTLPMRSSCPIRNWSDISERTSAQTHSNDAVLPESEH